MSPRSAHDKAENFYLAFHEIAAKSFLSEIFFPLQVIRMLEEDNNRLERPDACPEQTYSLMLQCWDLKPEKRPTFAELHNIFSTNPFYADVKLPLKDKSTS